MDAINTMTVDHVVPPGKLLRSVQRTLQLQGSAQVSPRDNPVCDGSHSISLQNIMVRVLD